MRIIMCLKAHQEKYSSVLLATANRLKMSPSSYLNTRKNAEVRNSKRQIAHTYNISII